MPDFECTWWLDGIPVWLGGTGREWIHCCIKHDFGQLTNWGLGLCVGKSGYPAMGAIMLAGLALFGGIYRKLKQRKQHHV